MKRTALTSRPRRAILVPLLVAIGASALGSVFACAQIIGADADIVECTPERAERCNDGDPCTNDSCTRGKCFHDGIPTCGISCTSPADCDDGIPCTDDICYERRECRHTPKVNCTAPCTSASECDDGSVCTVDVCDAGTCRNDAVDCSGLDGPCVKGVCSPVTGMCTADACNTAVDPVTCETYVCDAQTQQCTPVLCENDGTNPCVEKVCIMGECTSEVVTDFGVIQNLSQTDCIYEVECLGGVAKTNTPADFEIPVDTDELPETIEYCHNRRALTCMQDVSMQPICTQCAADEDCPPLPCWNNFGCDAGGVCRYQAVDGGAPDPASVCSACENGGCVEGSRVCFPLELKCCEGDLCCTPDGCTLDGDPLDCSGPNCGGSPCSFAVCPTSGGGACSAPWTLPEDARCSGGTCDATGSCEGF